MTPASGRLVELLRRTRVLLLDFDGPVCSIFAGRPAPTVANELRDLAAAQGCPLREEPGNTDPVHTLRLIADSCPAEVVYAAASALRDAEVEAIKTATPTPGADALLWTAREAGRRVAIVSNNSEDAVRAYLTRHQLDAYVEHISARYDDMAPQRLKPEPDLIHRALSTLDIPAQDTALLGDSTADVQAGNAAGVAVIGYANASGKRQRLTTAGAQVVVDTLDTLTAALRTIGSVRPS